MTDAPETAGLPEEPGAETLPERSMPSSQPVLLRGLKWGGIATVLLIIGCGAVGYVLADQPGLVGGVLGAAFAGLFLGLTIGSIAFANRFVANELYVVGFFGIVVGGWLVKFIGFIVAAVLLRDQPWLDPKILFFSLILSVVVSLTIDVFIVTKSRLPYVSDPGSQGV